MSTSFLCALAQPPGNIALDRKRKTHLGHVEQPVIDRHIHFRDVLAELRHQPRHRITRCLLHKAIRNRWLQ